MITNRTYGMDADVISYNARIVAGGNQSLSMQSLRQLNQFVISIKKMGLWYNMVFWPLRANQNAGTGLTAYSLGGLGTYNGTLVNNPRWGIDGVTTTSAASSTITTNTPNDLLFSKGTIGYIAKFETTYNSPYFHYWFPMAWQFIGFTGGILLQPTIQGGTNNVLTTIDSPNPSPTLFEFKAFSFGASSIIGNRNGVTANSTTRTQTPSSISTAHTLLNGNSTMSFGLAFNTDLTNAQMVLFYSLYKTTLGQDLALP